MPYTVSGSFPDFPGLDIGIEREEVYDTNILKTVSGKEQRTSWSTTPIIRYTLRFNVVRNDVSASSPNQALSEAQTLLGFLETYKGAYGTFNFSDPFTGATTVVRMEDSLRMTKIYNYGWEAEVMLTSVK
jgi:hypothetical protein